MPKESVGRRPSPGAEVSALHETRQGFQDPLAASSRTHTTPARMQLLHGQSILKVLRTKPLTAPAPGSDRRLSGEGHQVGGHRHRSDHEPQRPVPGMRRWRPGARQGMHLQRERAYLHTRDLRHVHGQRGARCVPDRGVGRGVSRSLTDSLLASLTCGGPGQDGIIHERRRDPLDSAINLVAHILH